MNASPNCEKLCQDLAEFHVTLLQNLRVSLWKALFLVIAIGVLPAFAGSDEPGVSNLMEMKWTGNVKPSSEKIFEGGSDYSLRWEAGHAPTSRARLLLGDYGTLTDWSSNHTLEVSIYAEEPNETLITIAAYPEPLESDEASYYFYRIPVDWSGWKEFSIPLAKFSPVRSPDGWSRISRLEFMSHHGASPIPGTILYLNNIRLKP